MPIRLMVTIFRELYHQDLLDTTYYAHDSFLTTQRKVDVAAEVRQRIEYLTNQVQTLGDQRLKANAQDKNALFAKGYAKGLHAAFITLADHSYFSAARQGLAARNDSEAVLKIDPEYADADMAIGIQQFAVANLPRFVRMMVGIAGVGGNKETGLEAGADLGGEGRRDDGGGAHDAVRCFCGTTVGTRRRWRCSTDWRRSSRMTTCSGWRRRT